LPGFIRHFRKIKDPYASHQVHKFWELYFQKKTNQSNNENFEVKNHYKLRLKVRQNMTFIKILFKKQDKNVEPTPDKLNPLMEFCVKKSARFSVRNNENR